jgi:hypothetical protein
MSIYQVSMTRRAILAFAVAVALLVSTIGLPGAVGAATPPAPIARLQVVVKEVKIHNDREGWLSGDGEMQIYTGIWRCKPDNPPPCHPYYGPRGAVRGMQDPDRNGAWNIARGARLLNAGTGDTVTLDQEVPGHGDLMWWSGTAPELGFAIYDDEQYVIHFDMLETDDGYENDDEYMGYVEHTLDNRNLGLGIGTHTVRSVQEDGDKGDYTVTYEIRSIPMADLEPITIRVDGEPGSTTQRVCMIVHNSGPIHAGAFRVTLQVDGAVPSDGRYEISGLASGTNYLACVPNTKLTPGQHKLSMTIDPTSAIREYNETNNYLEIPYTAAPSKTGAPSAGQVDLTVSAIKVNGQVPDGKDACKPGKSTVTVMVKNGGKDTAGLFTTRLSVDGVDVAEQSAVDLPAGQEQEVHFVGVQLKKGDHKLTALADVNRQVFETNEDNNALTVTARCGDD